jgi:hypothetical protein
MTYREAVHEPGPAGESLGEPGITHADMKDVLLSQIHSFEYLLDPRLVDRRLLLGVINPNRHIGGEAGMLQTATDLEA